MLSRFTNIQRLYSVAFFADRATLSI